MMLFLLTKHARTQAGHLNSGFYRTEFRNKTDRSLLFCSHLDRSAVSSGLKILSLPSSYIFRVKKPMPQDSAASELAGHHPLTL
jgi:hypothetical protein